MTPHQVRVYKNLHKTTVEGGPVYSVQTRAPKGWRVTGHASNVLLANPTFKVYEAGRLRTLAQGQKVVHAFVCGDIVHMLPTICPTTAHMTLPTGETLAPVPVSYNPKRGPLFYRKDNGSPTSGGKFAVVGPNGVSLYGAV